MVGKGKSRRRLALMVALALSTGGGCLTSVDGGMIWGMSKAYAAETHDYTETATSINGLEGTDKTGFMSDNKITLGTEGGATDKPFSTYGTISGGGKKNATADVSNNTLTIHGLKVSNGSGQSMIYGGISGTGAVTNNRVFFNNGLSKDPIYGGFNGASATKAVTGNTVTVAGGTVEGDVQGGGTAGTGTVTGNSITLKGGTFGDEAMGGIIRNASSSADVTGNTVTIAGGRFTRNNTFVHGGYTQGAGKTTGNTVNLGDGENAMASGTDLTKVNLVGGNKSDDVTGNTLNVNASGIIARTAQNFEKYNFNLTKGVTVGTDNSSILNNTMLKLTEGSAFGNTRVQWKNITLNAEKWHDDKTRYGKIGTVQMLWGGAGSSLKVYHDAVMDRTATSGDFEYHMYADVTHAPILDGYNLLNYVRADINRFQNADATYNGEAVTGDTLYGGYSSQTNTVTNNKLKVTAMLPSGKRDNVYAGFHAGTAGDVTKNTLTIELPYDYASLTNVYGGVINNADNGGEVSENKVVFSGNHVTTVTGGLSKGAGTLKGNTVEFRGSNSQAGTLRGAQSEGAGRVEENGVTISGSSYTQNAYGAETGNTGTAEKNYVTLAGGTVGDEIAGGVGNHVNGNIVTIESGKVGGYYGDGKVYGGKIVGIGGTSSGNIVNLGAQDGSAYTGDLRGATIAGDNTTDGAVNNNVLNVRGKGITVSGVNNFDKYNFKLSNNIGSGDTMLTLRYGGFGREIDFANNFNVDMSELTNGKPNGTITLIKSENTNALKFKEGYSLRDLGSTDNAEYFIGTDTGMREASAVVINYSVFKNNAFTYDNTNPENAAEIFAGMSYAGHTTENNTLTVTNTSATKNVDAAYGGKTAGAMGNSMNNKVIVENTDATNTRRIKSTYGGAITNSANAGTVTGNSVTVKNGKFGAIYGGSTAGTGAVGGTSEDAAAAAKLRNTVTFENGSASKLYGGHISNADSTASVTGNSVTTKGGTFDELYGGYIEGKGSANRNTVTVDGGASSSHRGSDVYGGYVKGGSDRTGGDANNNTVNINGTTASGYGLGSIYGGRAVRNGNASDNVVNINGGKVYSVFSGFVDSQNTSGTGKASNNVITITGGQIGSYGSGEVYGGYVSTFGIEKSRSNIINIGDGMNDLAEGTNLASAIFYGNNASRILNDNEYDIKGNTLNIKARNAQVKAIRNFEKLNFFLNDKIEGGDTMLSFSATGGLHRSNSSGAVYDIAEFHVEEDSFTKWRANKNRNARNDINLVSAYTSSYDNETFDFTDTTNLATPRISADGDYECAQHLSDDATAATSSTGSAVGAKKAKSVVLTANRFRNGDWTYDGTQRTTAVDSTTTEIYGGYSKYGNTTKKNKLKVTSVDGNLTSAYGGKTDGAGDSAYNEVTVENTGTGAISNVIGGAAAAANGKAEHNIVTIDNGTFGAVYGGLVTGANGSTDHNEVMINGGTVQNAVIGGGGVPTAAGNMSNNRVTITGGTVTGQIIGGDSRVLTSTSNNNTITLGGGTLTGSQVWGTSYGDTVLANTDAKIAGNTLNVEAKDGVTLKKVRNVEKFNFQLVDDTTKTAPLLNLTEAGGFGKVTADNSDVKVKWSNVTADMSKVTTEADAAKIQGKNTYILMRAADPTLKFSDYSARYDTYGGVYETRLRTNADADTAKEVLYDVNRFKDGRITYTAESMSDAFGGYSAFGHTAEGNAFTLKGISEGKTLQYVSGGRSEGTAGGAVKNTVNLLSTGKGTLEEVYGGYVGSVANAADVTENTVNIAGGTAKNVYGGYTRGTGKTVKNTVNIGYTDEAGVFHDVADGAKITGTIYGGSGSDATGNVLNVSGKIAAGNIKNFESVKFHVRNTMASGTTLLTLDGAAATEGLDWANVTLDEFKPVVKSYEAYRLALMANEKGIDFRKGGVDTYAPIGAKGVTKGDYEAALDTDTHAAQAKAVNAEIYRFHGNMATYGEADGAHDAAWGGRSVLGNDATDNTLTISGGTLKDAYGGWSTGKKADGTSGKTTGNTVNFTGGTVTGTIYGGNNGAAGNTLNVTGIQSAGDIKNFEKLHFDTSMAKAGDTILTLNGGKKTTGLDWQKVEAAGLDEASLATRTGVAREELFSLMANDKGIDFGTTYDKAKEKTVGDYEYAIAKEADAAKGAAAEKVVVRGFRFQNNADSVYETGDNKAAWGGRSIIGNTVQRNKLTVKGGTLTEAAYGGLSAKGAVTDNTLVLAGGTLKNAYGGFVEGAGDATKNTVEVQKDTQAQIYGGYAAQGEASGNILNLGAVNIGANVYGGSGKKTDGNVINLFGTKIKGTVTGGTAADGKANVLAIRAAGTEIGDFKGIQNLKFYLPEGAKSSMATMLRLGVKDKDIKGLNVDLNLSGAAKTLKREDVFSLMKVAEGGTLTTDEKIKGEVTGTQGVSLDYKFRVQKKGADELIAAVESVKMKNATKSLAETRTTATDVLGGGMTMLADAGVSAAVQAAASANANAQVEAAPMATNKAPSAKAASAANVQSGAYTAWAVQGGSSMRIHSGSYVDTHGYTLNVGFARKQEGKDSTLTFGPFVEYGRASYDSYLEDAAGTHGSGKVSYIGAGVLARQDLKNGLYLEGSVRGGRIKSDYEGNISGTSTSYDISNPYYAIHLGVGKETKLKAGDALETYLKYFFSHQNGTSGKLSTGEDYDFDAVNSHRLRLGARYTHDMGEEGKFYAGLAWEYEFNGEARATYQGMATPSPSLKGGSAMLELGYRFTPKKSRVSYDVNFSGWQGKREGFSGSVGVNWAF